MKLRLFAFLLSTVLLLPFSAYCDGIPGHGSVWLNIYDPVADVPVIITDQLGRRFGVSADGGGLVSEFAGTYKPSRGAADDSEQLRSEIKFPAHPGEYLIEAAGETLQTFKIRLFVIRGYNDEFFEIKGVTEKGSRSRFLLSINQGQDGSLATLSRVADLASLKKDISLAVKVGWIRSKVLAIELLKKADSVERAASSGDMAMAGGELESFMDEVASERGGLIKEDGAVVLLEDGAGIMGRGSRGVE